MSHEKVEHTSQIKRDQVIKYLEQLLRGFQAGAVQISESDHSLRLSPSEICDLAVRADQHKDKESICVSLTWPRVVHADDTEGLSILAESDGDQDTSRKSRSSKKNSQSNKSSSSSRSSSKSKNKKSSGRSKARSK